MLIHNHAQNQSSVIDFREVAPAGTDGAAAGAQTGALSVGVPGLLRGLWLAHSRHGRLGWSALLEPSVQLARAGTKVTAPLAAALAAHLTVRQAQDSPALSALAADGRLLKAGQQMVQTGLASTLNKLQVQGVDGELLLVWLEETDCSPSLSFHFEFRLIGLVLLADLAAEGIGEAL